MTEEKGKIRENAIYRIQDMEASERPREKLAQQGTSRLSDQELLAILLRVGVEGMNAIQMADMLLKKFKGLRGLYLADYQELCQIHGIGPAKAAQLMAAMELGARVGKAKNKDVVISQPSDVAELVGYELGLIDQEEMIVLLLNTRNQVLDKVELYRGSVNSSQVRVGELFKAAVKANAPSIILVHNHPSGDPNPSPDDIAITRAAIQAGKLLDIEVLDHIVIGMNGFVSMKAKNMAFG
jgi:DNA repair protein RadC